MSEIKRKPQTGGFESGEGAFDELKGAAESPDFSILEDESGWTIGAAEEPAQYSEPEAEPAGSIFEPITPIEQKPKPNIEKAPAQPAEEEPAKKRYYSPGEVMKKKGCIGCGGMVLAVPIILAVLVAAVALF